MLALSALGYSLARLRQELCTQLSGEVLPHTVTALTFSKDAFLAVPKSSARRDHCRKADRLLPSSNTAELNQTISAHINAPWHKAG